MLGPLLILLYTSDLSTILELILVGYAVDSTLLPEVPKTGISAPSESSLNRDLAAIVGLCKLWRMVVNIIMIKYLVISWLRTLVPSYPDLLLNGTVVEKVTELNECSFSGCYHKTLF